MNDRLTVSMKLASGEFESELKMPFPPKNPDEVGKQIGAWLKMCAAGLEPLVDASPTVDGEKN